MTAFLLALVLATPAFSTPCREDRPRAEARSRELQRLVAKDQADRQDNKLDPGSVERDLVRRKLDCAMLNWAIPVIEKELGVQFQTVRGVFQEGIPAYPGSGILRKSHIQVVVRDKACILGYFLPET